jgi:hypothetical protein
MKIKESYGNLLDTSKPLIPQLREVKRKCFLPYYSDFQLIKYKCEDCSRERKFRSCLFHEATHLSCFSKHLEEIQNSKDIPKPKNFHPKTERLCARKHPLEDILRGTWAVFLHDREEPFNINTPEHKEWRQERKEVVKKLPCESTCKMVDYCAFYQNGVNVRLCFTEIESYDEDEIYYKKHNHDTHKGYIKDSYLYKNFIKGSKVKELPTVRTDGSRKKLDEWHYRVYEKVFNAVKHQKKIKVTLVKFIFDILMSQPESEEILITYLFGRSVSFDFKLLNEKWSKFGIPFEKHLITIKRLGLLGTLEQTTKLKKIRNLSQKYKEVLDENSWRLLEIDLTFLLEYSKQRKLNFFDCFYEFFLSQEKLPSREEIREKFKISQPSQIEIERRLGVKKEFRNKDKAQLTNLYLINSYCVGAIFKFLSTEKSKEVLAEIAKKNKTECGIIKGDV